MTSSGPDDAYDATGERIELAAPVRQAKDEVLLPPQAGIGLCLSGGGYRAMLFHLGSLWRLNELGYLPRVSRISSVSGGSITAGVLGVAFRDLTFTSGRADNFLDAVVAPIRRIASVTIDRRAVIRGLLTPRRSIADLVASAYDQHLFHGATLQSLPDQPRFVLNATNVQSGVLCRFSKPYLWDYRVGRIDKPEVPMATAVAASAGFPPILSPVQLPLDPRQFVADSGQDLQSDEYRRRLYLTDGGVYDNLGLETVWKRYRTVLVSDAGGKMGPEPNPHVDWARHTYRVLDMVDNQVRSLRKRQLIASYQADEAALTFRHGAYWGIRSAIANYPQPPALPCPPTATSALASTPTRLAELDEPRQKGLINWGYAICDAALQSYMDPPPPTDPPAPPPAFPYPEAALDK